MLLSLGLIAAVSTVRMTLYPSAPYIAGGGKRFNLAAAQAANDGWAAKRQRKRSGRVWDMYATSTRVANPAGKECGAGMPSIGFG